MILVEPENPDNIGAAARAMKNMGFSDLRLVKPPRRWKTRGKKMAMHAYDLLQGARTFKSLEAAIADCQTVIGTTRRKGAKRDAFLPFDETLKVIKKKSSKWRHAIVFGRESKGLSNQDLALCDWMTALPSEDACPSINLAQAVMIVAFSLKVVTRRGALVYLLNERITARNILKTRWIYATKEETFNVLERLKGALIRLEYEEQGPEVIERILASFHRLIKRSGLLHSEAQMFKGLCRQIERKLG